MSVADVSTWQRDGVVLLPGSEPTSLHERSVHEALGATLASMLGCRFLGDYDRQRHVGGRYYFIPAHTLLGRARHEALGIGCTADFFGGRVEQPFMATKAITHALPGFARHVPRGWCREFARRAADAILVGYTVFDLEEGRRAGEELLERGPVRIKPVLGKAGRGQRVVSEATALAEAIAAQDAAQVATWGLVLEEDLVDEVVTYSVGQVQVAGITASYYGTQALTEDNSGERVYGGSELLVVRGGYAELLALPLEAAARTAINQARTYEDAAIAGFPGFLASRRNYDVAQGRNARGETCSGVLEQSWRIGGASAAEVHALAALATDPSLRCIRAATIERYGAANPPADAIVLFQGEDPEVGRISKSVRLEPYEYQQ